VADGGPGRERGRLRQHPQHQEVAVYVIREVLHCKPGKVRPLLEKFQAISNALEEAGHPRFRLLTDASGELFWTMVAETTTEGIDEFFEVEKQLMSNPALGKVMAGYHDLIVDGRREIYRLVE
jgi:hypothetical protein